MTDKNQVENMVKSIVETFGGIDVLHQQCGRCATLRAKDSSERLDSDDLRSLLDLNVVSVHIVTVAVLRQSMLKNGGRIVNISSRDGNMGLPAVSFNMNATARSGKHRNLLIAAVDTTSRLFGTYTQPLSSLYLVSSIFLLISL